MEELKPNKYQSIIDIFEIKDIGVIEKINTSLDFSINYLNDNYDAASTDEKIVAIYVTMKIILKNGGLYNEDELIKIIKRYFTYHKDEYQKYIDNMAIITDQFECDFLFYKRFITNETKTT
jgi:hypothetical protein